MYFRPGAVRLSLLSFVEAHQKTLFDEHHAANARFRLWQDEVVVANYGDRAEDEQSQVRTLALCDLSTLDRCGFKGSDAPDWLAQQGLQVPAAANQSSYASQAGLIARLSNEEHLLLCDPFSDAPRAPIFTPQCELSISIAWVSASGELSERSV